MIISADPFHSPENIGKMPAKCSSVAMQFINHDILQIGKYKIKSIFTVVRQESCIQHLRIRQDNIRTLPDPAAFCRHRISIIDPCRYTPLTKILQYRSQYPILITCKCFRRINKNRTRQRIL